MSENFTFRQDPFYLQFILILGLGLISKNDEGVSLAD